MFCVLPQGPVGVSGVAGVCRDCACWCADPCRVCHLDSAAHMQLGCSCLAITIQLLPAQPQAVAVRRRGGAAAPGHRGAGRRGGAGGRPAGHGGGGGQAGRGHAAHAAQGGAGRGRAGRAGGGWRGEGSPLAGEQPGGRGAARSCSQLGVDMQLTLHKLGCPERLFARGQCQVL